MKAVCLLQETMYILKAVGKKKTVKLDWKKISEAEEYVIYGNRCGSKMQKLITVNGNKKTYTFKNLPISRVIQNFFIDRKNNRIYGTMIRPNANGKED